MWLLPSLPEQVTRLRPKNRRESSKELFLHGARVRRRHAARPISGLEWWRTRGVHAVQVQRLTMGHLQARMEVWASQGAQDGIEYRYPLLDRRVLEFCLGAPARVLRRR
jgi:phage baseplate assembly protein gpV